MARFGDRGPSLREIYIKPSSPMRAAPARSASSQAKLGSTEFKGPIPDLGRAPDAARHALTIDDHDVSSDKRECGFSTFTALLFCHLGS
jgi:hypothetical protein